jgi:hypothetical protein
MAELVESLPVDPRVKGSNICTACKFLKACYSKAPIAGLSRQIIHMFYMGLIIQSPFDSTC